MADLYGQDGQPLPYCGRGALKRAIAAWKDKGYTPKIGIELECFALTRNEDGQWQGYDAPGGVVYGTGPFADDTGFMDAIWDQAHELGFALDNMTAEYDTPQFEFTLTFDEALKAMDDIVLFRQMAREVAYEHGVMLSFTPKPLEDKGGSGMHINFSFEDRNGKNSLTMPADAGEDAMSDLAQGCVAGLMHHHKGLAGLIAPTVPSYTRLQPASLSGYWQNWARDHRSVTTRVNDQRSNSARIEHRTADASANPYTAVAAVLQAAYLGMDNGYDLPAMETGDCFENTDATVHVGESLEAAIADLEADTALAEAVGADLVANHVFMKREEVEKTKDLEGDALRDFYLPYI